MNSIDGHKRTAFVWRPLAAAIALSLAGCTADPDKTTSIKSPETVSSTSIGNEFSTQHSLKTFAEQLNITYQVLDNRANEKCQSEIADKLCFQSELTLSLSDESKITLPADMRNWSLFFSHMAPIQFNGSDEFVIEHINGDLHRLAPTDAFTGFSKGESKSIPLRAAFWHLASSDIMPNYYVTSASLKPEIVRSTASQLDADTQLEILPHAGSFDDPERHLKRTPQDQSKVATSAWIYQQLSMQPGNAEQLKDFGLESAIIPTPRSLIQNSGTLSLEDGIRLTGEIPSRDRIETALSALEKNGVAESPNGLAVIFESLSHAENDNPEAYQVRIEANQIVISSHSETGAYYGLRTLDSLLLVDQATVPRVTIDDQPRYGFRGMHLDVARNFRDKDYVIALLEQMSRYKLNRLHLHLGDDEGWRLEIDDLPELTEIGAQRCHDPEENRCLLPQLGSGPFIHSDANGFYSKKDYQDILKAAQARHIEVIPSFDMPGHSRAAVVSMEARYRKFLSQEQRQEAERYRLIDPQDKTQYRSIQYYNDNTLNVCLDSTYRFVDKVLSEVIELHDEARVPFTRYHIGADETAGAWIESPACEALLNDSQRDLNDHHDLTGYFVERVANMVAEKGIVPAGWNDGMSTTDPARMPAAVQSNAWTPLFWDGHAKAHEQANRHWQVVLSIPDVTYFDFPYAVDPQERGYYWASRATDSQQAFEFMPDNLPIHAEVWGDRENRPMTLDDRNSVLHRGNEFYGLQGHLWTETVRSDQQADYMIFPRLIALAERAWHKADWEPEYNYDGALYSKDTQNFTQQHQQAMQKDWARFSQILARKELLKLDRDGMHYRIPTVGAELNDQQLTILSPLPGLPLQYRIGSGDWQDYQSPTVIDSTSEKIWVRARSADGHRSGRALAIN